MSYVCYSKNLNEQCLQILKLNFADLIFHLKCGSMFSDISVTISVLFVLMVYCYKNKVIADFTAWKVLRLFIGMVFTSSGVEIKGVGHKKNIQYVISKEIWGKYVNKKYHQVAET